MARILGYLSNDPSRLRCAVYPYRDDLVVPEQVRHDGWGLGYFQTGEILLQKRPQLSREAVRAADLVGSLHTDALLFHVREATVGSWTLDNTHPFRYRSWLFAHRGTISAFPAVKAKLSERIPLFVRRSLRGETDSAYLFHLFISHLIEAGKLEDPNVDPRFVAGVLARTLAEVDQLSAEAGAEGPSRCNVALTNGRVLIATRRGLPLHYLRREGILDCGVCADPTAGQKGSRAPAVNHALLTYVLVASDLGQPGLGQPGDLPHRSPDWQEVPDGSVLTVQRNLGTAVAPLAL